MAVHIEKNGYLIMKKSTYSFQELETTLQESITISPCKSARFFKMDEGQYGHHDNFLGITNPTLRAISKKYQDLPINDIQSLLQSCYNEKRLLGLFILVAQYQKSEKNTQEEIYDFYIKNLAAVNNWNLVDSSAHLIMGAHLHTKDKQMLLDLSASENIWHRRIAIVATWWFIRKNDLKWTFAISKALMADKHDLIHKATGWMLREAGKKNKEELLLFLNKHHTIMPRTMLRYAIEKLSIEEKKHYLQKKGS